MSSLKSSAHGINYAKKLLIRFDEGGCDVGRGNTWERGWLRAEQRAKKGTGVTERQNSSWKEIVQAATSFLPAARAGGGHRRPARQKRAAHVSLQDTKVEEEPIEKRCVTWE